MTIEQFVEALAEIANSGVSPEWAIARSARILNPYLANFDGDKTDERLRIALAFAEAMKRRLR